MCNQSSLFMLHCNAYILCTDTVELGIEDPRFDMIIRFTQQIQEL